MMGLSQKWAEDDVSYWYQGRAVLRGRYSLKMVVSARAMRTKAVAVMLLKWLRAVRWRQKK